MQVLVSVGRGTDLAQYAGAPSNFTFVDAVPQLAVLERARIFLTHGGLNSVHEGLWHGVPMVAVPQQIEQLHNAEAMQAAGAGLLVDIKARGGRVTAAALRDAVERIEADHSRFAAAAARMGDTLRAGGGFVAAADRIEEIARRRSAAVHAAPSKASPTGA
jgi:MGT family glycosyltransferase